MYLFILIKPALNAYIYTKRLLKVTFEKVIGMPKIDAVILIKGDDAESIFIFKIESSWMITYHMNKLKILL